MTSTKVARAPSSTLEHQDQPFANSVAVCSFNCLIDCSLMCESLHIFLSFFLPVHLVNYGYKFKEESMSIYSEALDS